VLTAVAFQYGLVKGPGRNIPVAQAINGHAPSEMPSQANILALPDRFETRIPTLPVIIANPNISQEVVKVRFRRKICWARAGRASA
jgi:hypothetical protein